MKKNLDPTAILNELKGSSLYFPNEEVTSIPDPAETPSPRDPARISKDLGPSPRGRQRAERTRGQSPYNDSTTANVLASYHASVIENIRKSVKTVGKEVTFVRLTPEEKRALADIAYTYKRRGVKTSENEVARIGINFLLEDYRGSGEESLLARVIEALLA